MAWLTPDESTALYLSLTVAGRSVLLNLPFAILIAWVLTRGRFVGRTVLDAIVHLPMVLPPVVVGFVLLLIFGTRGSSARGSTACFDISWYSRATAPRSPPP
jgi:molybdate transport system permease protein